MIKFVRKSSALALLILLIPLGGISAVQDDGVYTYIFHLYFNNGNLTKDRDFDPPFELIAQEYEGVDRTTMSYYGEIISVSNKKLADFPIFTPAAGKGKFSANAPFFDNAKTANFYDDQNQKLLTIDLAPSGPVCNEDKICNKDTGETYLNCSNDCSAPVSSAIPSPTSFSDAKHTFSDYLIDFLSFPFSLVILGVILVVFVWFFLKRKKTKLSAETPPSNLR